jgi:cytochrome c-type biogenesis protein CcmF
LDVYRGGKKILTLTPEKRFYHASGQPSTVVALHSTPEADLYVIFMGRNPATNRPIVKVFLNPLITWIWIGFLIVVAGTCFALVPSASPKRREAAAPLAMPVAVEVAGD